MKITSKCSGKTKKRRCSGMLNILLIVQESFSKSHSAVGLRTVPNRNGFHRDCSMHHCRMILNEMFSITKFLKRKIDIYAIFWFPIKPLKP